MTEESKYLTATRKRGDSNASISFVSVPKRPSTVNQVQTTNMIDTPPSEIENHYIYDLSIQVNEIVMERKTTEKSHHSTKSDAFLRIESLPTPNVPLTDIEISRISISNPEVIQNTLQRSRKSSYRPSISQDATNTTSRPSILKKKTIDTPIVNENIIISIPNDTASSFDDKGDDQDLKVFLNVDFDENNILAILNYTAQQEDEISIHIGDKLLLLHHFPDNWVLGKNMTIGTTGIFPYVCISSRKRSFTSDESPKSILPSPGGDPGIKKSGTNSFCNGNYTKGFNYILKSHCMKNNLATSILGFCFEFGIGIDRNLKTSFKLYTISDMIPLSQLRLAFLLTHGRSGIIINIKLASFYYKLIEIHFKKSICWLQLLAHHGLPHAQFCLAVAYLKSNSCHHNIELTFYWCQKSARLNFSQSENLLGNLYVEGLGCEKDVDLGMLYYIRAAEKREATSIYNIGTLFERGLGVEASMTTAIQWYKRAAIYNSINAHNCLGIFYEQGLIDVPNCDELAVYHYTQASLAGNSHAQYNLARCYHTGLGCEKNNTIAFDLYQQASHQDHQLAQLSLAICYEFGFGIEINTELAFQSYVTAAQNDSEPAKLRLIPMVIKRVLDCSMALVTNSKSNPFNQLPVELVLEILSYVNTLQLISNQDLMDIYTSTLISSKRAKKQILKMENQINVELKKNCSCRSENCTKIFHIVVGLRRLSMF
ncbi:hypothetical protein BC833DRAFT_566268 [Globomyces pollinis-pini]|nr:hypothetical protein BC833DRAFT_566268 [Globomyces pollinis-pini]